ncbi:MAG: hypothetical protein ACOCQQ_02840 [Candidatus Nanoarchaeia archaeon]
MSNEKITHKQFLEIQVKYLNGVSVEELAKEHGVSRNAIYLRLNKNIVKNNQTKKRGRNLTKEIIENIKNDAKNGVNKSEIAKKYNVSYPTVYKHTLNIRPENKIRLQKLRNDLPKIVKRIEDGEQKTKIAEEYGVHTKHVFDLTKGVKSKRYKLSPDEQKKLFTEYMKGASYEELEEMFGLSNGSVYNYIIRGFRFFGNNV